MGDGRLNRAIETGRARTSEIKTRVPEIRERMPEIRERVPELGNELRTRGTELRARGTELARHYAKLDVSWARCGYARAIREGLLSGVLGPMTDFYLKRRSAGREIFNDGLAQPVIFVANHSSHLDTPTILRAIPRRWRNRTAVAAAADYFYEKRWKAAGVALLFNTVPIGRQGGGLEEGATDHVDRLLDQGWNLLMFPEGTRSRDGDVGKLRSGAAVIAARHGIPIVPIHVSGTHDAMPPGQNWPRRRRARLFLTRRHKVVVAFGEPIAVADAGERRAAMERVREFWERGGEAAPAPEPLDVLILHEALRVQEEALERDPARRFEPVVELDSEPTHRQSAPVA
jgi:1-acyl-sn-glycerol-3-phosphate acyltransferase